MDNVKIIRTFAKLTASGNPSVSRWMVASNGRVAYSERKGHVMPSHRTVADLEVDARVKEVRTR